MGDAILNHEEEGGKAQLDEWVAVSDTRVSVDSMINTSENQRDKIEMNRTEHIL